MTLLTTLFTVQNFAAITSFIAAALVVAVVIFLIVTSQEDEDKASAKHKVYGLRGKYFFVLVILIIAGLFTSLRMLPYDAPQGNPDQIVSVVAMQWAWKMAEGTMDKSPQEFEGTNEITVPSGKLIQFNVTSADVNHNFAVYNTKGDIVAQTQAMPGYTNRLFFTFPDKGEYHILCLEYCGLAHGFMIGKINVN